MELYLTRPGDSLGSIARRFGATAEQLAYMNQLGDPRRLIPNMALLVPGPERPIRQEVMVNGYAFPSISGAVLKETLPYLSFLCPFSYRLTADGELIGIDDGPLVDAARAENTAPFLTVSNLSEGGGFSSKITHALFSDAAVQDTAMENILSALEQRPYAGVSFSFQYVYPFDREGYNRFLRRAAETLHDKGYYVITALAPKESADQDGLLCAAHDYAAHGLWADWVVLMTYDWGYTYSAPQAVAPISRVRRVLSYATSQIPVGNLLLGLSNYGYCWALPWRQGDAATVIANAAAQNLAVSVGAELRYDRSSAAPWFTYTEPMGQRRVVWFEDARSIREKLQLVREFNIAGVSYWPINQLFRPGLLLLEDGFSVRKIL